MAVDSATPDYRRAHVPGGTYFFTVNTYRRQTFLIDADVRSALGDRILANELARTRTLRSLKCYDAAQNRNNP